MPPIASTPAPPAPTTTEETEGSVAPVAGGPGPSSPDAPQGPDGGRDATGRTDAAVLRWGLGAYLTAVVAVVAVTVARLGGHLAYVLDDPAIHLSVAERLAHHGTWGVVPGSFESASSSPLWTVAVAAGVALAPPARDLVPLVLNVAAGVGVVWLLARERTAIRPGRGRPADAAVLAVLVVAVLFLPGLAVVGMEHTLQVALVLAAVVAVRRAVAPPAATAPGARPPWPTGVRWACVLLALASLTRFETAFVAVGLAAGLLVVDARAHLRRAAAVLAASAVPIAAFAALNRALGGGWLPNSLLVKGRGLGLAGSGAPGGVAGGDGVGPADDGLGPVDVAQRLAQDPVVAVLFVLAVLVLAVRGRRSPSQALVATTLAVATLLHATLADVGWYERYQAYLVALGVVLLLDVLADLPADVARRALPALAALGLVLAADKVSLLVQAPFAADDMYRQQVQAGRFLDRYYGGEPVATDQLGYISLLHEGPLTDLAGLGDHEVLEARRHTAVTPLWERLARQRGFRVVVLYDITAGPNVPPGWVLAGQWELEGPSVSGVSRTLQFFATVPGEVAPLQAHLDDFADDLPARTHLELNGFATMQAAALADPPPPP